VLEDLINCIRDLGSLGPTWTHQWDPDNGKKMKKIELPLDQSKCIFNKNQLEGLYKAVDIAVADGQKDKRRAWKLFLESYVTAFDILTQSTDYTDETIDTLRTHMDKCYATWVYEVAGIRGVTNYFHYFGSGHIIWLIRRYGNLWRFRN
jgi:hypothetical protein